ncbi:HERC5, partial [Symbiodinium pilosum]
MRCLFLCAPPLVLATVVEQRTQGVGFHCALLRFNAQRTELSCWGQNDKGQLGQGDTMPRPTQQAVVLLGSQAVQISSGAYHSCALLETGQVKCWGANNRGQLGLGDSANRGDDPKEMGDWLSPVSLGNCKAVEVRVGTEHSCARLEDGRVKCWGGNGQGQALTGGPASIGLWPWELGEALVPESLGTNRRAISLLAGS